MFSRKEILFWVIALVMGVILAWSCRLDAADNSTKKIYPNHLLYNSTSSCVQGIVNLMISLNPPLAQQPVPPDVLQQMIGHCSCVVDKIRNDHTFEEYSRNMSNYMWVRDIWAKYSKPCLDEGHLNGSGILPPAQPIPDPAIEKDQGIPLEIPDFAKGVLPHLS